MATTVTLTIPDELYQRAETIAKSSALTVNDVLAQSIFLEETIDGSLPPDLNAAIEQERKAFQNLHPTLLEKYFGKHVAILDEKVVDFDNDFTTLFSRVRHRFPDHFVLIRRVEEEKEPVYYFRSPRFAPADES